MLSFLSNQLHTRAQPRGSCQDPHELEDMIEATAVPFLACWWQARRWTRKAARDEQCAHVDIDDGDAHEALQLAEVGHPAPGLRRRRLERIHCTGQGKPQSAAQLTPTGRR